MASDAELLEAVRAGDEEAFGMLVDRYHEHLVRLAQSVVGRRELARDVAQDTWMAVVRGVDRFEGRSAFRTWLFRICVNRARSALGRELRSVPVDTGGPTVDPSRFSSDGRWAEPPLDWTAVVDDRIVAGELAVRARQALAELPDLQRQVVTLRDVEGLSTDEVAQVLSLTPGNTRVVLHRGRAAVRSALDRHLRGG